ncbi:sodium:calcium antiporter [Stutzerimonas kirkiae]|uniref:sodium:calcium antiporter n=1 Tax=Stutzerimonas kirkiae TaxID=2211392 RepID=UPI0010382FCD|nr:sodium:calcium antiporter [Stutzerimonas kirkiae]TBV11625.1 sodium:calcium antiporter [Stutzerimonas kirkiae]
MSMFVFLHLALGLTLIIAGNEMTTAALARLGARLGKAWPADSNALLALNNTAPLLVVSVTAILKGHDDLALGSVLGGHIANLLAVLGGSALLAPLLIPARLLRVELPSLFGALLLAFVLAQDGTLGRLDASLLLLGSLAYILLRRRASPRLPTDARNAGGENGGIRQRRRTWLLGPLQLLLGITLLCSGADFLVDGVRDAAQLLGLSDLLSGLTLLALLTSIPLLLNICAGLLRGRRDTAAGHITTACIINLLGTLGLAALLSPQPLSISPNALDIDFPVMLMATLAVLMIFCAGKLPRWLGLLLLGHYAAYILYLALFATGRPQLERLGETMFHYALPLTALALAIHLWRSR